MVRRSKKTLKEAEEITDDVEFRTRAIRWMIQNDWENVLADSACTEEDLKIFLKPKESIGMVIELLGPSLMDGEFVGHMLYTLYPDHLEIFELHIKKAHRRCGHAEALINRLKDKLLKLSERRYISMWVYEYDLDLQLFLRKQNFIATAIDQKEYRMEWFK